MSTSSGKSIDLKTAIGLATVPPSNKNGSTNQPFSELNQEGFSEYTDSKDELIFRFFIGSVSVLGLFVLYRIIQKSK